MGDIDDDRVHIDDDESKVHIGLVYDDDSKFHTIDSFLSGVAGECGPYQRCHYATTGAAWLSVSLATMSMIFTRKAPQWRLVNNTDLATELELPCDDAGSLSSGVALVDIVASASGEFGWVCGEASLAALVGTLYFVGFGVGAFGFGSVADSIGRRPSSQVSAAISAVFGLASATTASPTVYMASRMLTGIGIGGLATCSYVHATEMIGPSWQGVAGVGMSAIFSLGALLLVPLTMILPSWRALTLATAAAPALQLALLRC